jgi:hypothetical protein
MPADASTLDALRALLVSAKELAASLESDAALQRILHAALALDPEERDVLATALERGVAERRINEAFTRMNGVHLRINPHPRLFFRVLDPDRAPDTVALEADDVVPDVFRIMRRVRLLLTPEARAVWQPAAVEALGMLSDVEREACERFVGDLLPLITDPNGRRS